MFSKTVLGALLAVAVAQEGNDTAPFPDVTYPDAVSQNPLTSAGTQSNQTSPPKYPSPWASGAGDWADAWKRATEIVSQLTLEEKVNITTGTGWSLDDCVGNTGSVPRFGIRSLCMQDSPTAMRFGDFNSVFPSGVNLAAAWSRGFAIARGVAMGEEFRDKGVNGLLGPVAGPLGRSSEGGRNWEGFSPDPYLTGVLFAETVRGIQSTGQMAVGKHFIGNEQEHFRQVPETTQFDLGNITYPGSSNIDDTTLHELYLWPFADAVRAGLVSIMCSYNRINNSDACQNSYLQNYILKDELGFQGFIMSDWQATHSGVSSILAGLDMTMPGDVEFDTATSYFGPNLTIGVLNGSIPQWRLDDMATRILAAWYFVDGDSEENNKPTNFNSWTLDTYGSFHSYVGPEYGYVFGEDAGPNLEGPNGCADRGCAQGTVAIGWGSGTGNFPYLITPDAAIQREITDHYGAYESILSNGALTQIQALARRAAQVGVIHSTAQIEIQEWKDHPNVTAILWAGLPGEQSGNSLADVLYGRVNPGAKLPFTIGRNRSDYGTDTNAGPYTPTQRNTEPAPTYGTIDNNTSAHIFPEDATRIPYFIYPWINSSNLEDSYGATDYGDDSFIPEGARDGSAQPIPPAGGAPGGNPELWDVLYEVTVNITNTGKVVGDEVAQLYVSLGGEYDPKIVLRGFERVPINPGETVKVNFDLLRRDISNWDTVSQNWVITDAPKKGFEW
ncbi:Beta-glucosidase 1 [Pseudocercospora fuligena]|uniref:beta-glucosidase n=1 Tax=Pseudocercospora fuligena TaxID=685502 RepID=A0A8H6R6K4_9PEZI|nr:Beta-glucosidase 1 [Pseudocercospora fuligena]